MSGIVERLRDWPRVTPGACMEAADEIERLREEKTELLKKRNEEEMQKRIDYWGLRAEKAEAERDELLAALHPFSAALIEAEKDYPNDKQLHCQWAVQLADFERACAAIAKVEDSKWR
jgi:hypothetical protein